MTGTKGLLKALPRRVDFRALVVIPSGKEGLF